MLTDKGNILNVIREGIAARNLKKLLILGDSTKMVRYVSWGKCSIDERTARTVRVKRKSIIVSFSRWPGLQSTETRCSLIERGPKLSPAIASSFSFSGPSKGDEDRNEHEVSLRVSSAGKLSRVTHCSLPSSTWTSSRVRRLQLRDRNGKTTSTDRRIRLGSCSCKRTGKNMLLLIAGAVVIVQSCTCPRVHQHLDLNRNL